MSDRYLAPFPPGDPHHGQPADRLARALEAKDIDWGLDPDTARLGHTRAVRLQKPRAAGRRLSRAVPLPLSAERLSLPHHAQALAEAAAATQLRSRAFAAPYLEVSDIDDPRFAVNLDLLGRSRDLAGDRSLVAFLQVLRGRLLDGSAEELARRIVAHGAEVLFVRVRRFEAEQATEEDVAAYGRLIMVAERAGARVVADSVGRLGPALIAAGADGFAAGARWSRKVPDDLHPAGGGGGAHGTLLWEVPAGSSSTANAGTTVRCSVAGCDAVDGTGDTRAIRIHNLHEFQRAAREAAREGFAYGRRLGGDASPVVRGWGAALQLLERRAA